MDFTVDFDFSYTFKPKDLESFFKAGAFFSLPKTVGALNRDTAADDEYFLGLRPLGNVSDPEGATLVYAPTFFGEIDEPYVLFGQRAKLSKDEFLKALKEVPLDDLKSITWDEPDKTDFLNTFELILNEMDKGTLKKAVPIVYESAKYKISNALKAKCIQQLLQSDHGGFAYGFWDEEGGIIGLTPELLFSLDKNGVNTAALASTAKSTDELLKDPKLLKEHQLVIDDISSRLAKVGEVKPFKTEPKQYGSLFHLQTPIQVSNVKSEVNFEALIHQMHPTAALGVYPREFDWKWLRNLGGLRRRKRYGSPLGLRDESGHGFAIVGIRNIQWDKEEIWVSAGVGMIAESDPEKEWDELKLKRNLTKKILGL
jgi:menaquinone-specific isochorismate synthase